MTPEEAKLQKFKHGDKVVTNNGLIYCIEHIDFNKMRIYGSQYKNSLLVEISLEEIKQITG